MVNWEGYDIQNEGQENWQIQMVVSLIHVNKSCTWKPIHYKLLISLLRPQLGICDYKIPFYKRRIVIIASTVAEIIHTSNNFEADQTHISELIVCLSLSAYQKQIYFSNHIGSNPNMSSHYTRLPRSLTQKQNDKSHIAHQAKMKFAQYRNLVLVLVEEEKKIKLQIKVRFFSLLFYKGNFFTPLFYSIFELFLLIKNYCV